MWTLEVPVVHEFFVCWVDQGFVGVGFVECFDLSDCGWSTYACDDMFNPVSTAELRELRDASSSRVELGSSVGEDLRGFAVLPNAFFKELDGMFRCWVMMDL